MICQEVIELMQRYLDQDLDEIEYNQMLGHLQSCPECTQLFQRLLSVSEHLENLPKVIPAFSLVDAILPRLQHMDVAPAAMEFGALGQQEQHSGAMAQKKDIVTVTRLAGWRSRTRGLISARIIGGVVAAGLVFGFFMFDRQEQSHMQNADGTLLAPMSAKQSRSANKEQVNSTDALSAAGSNDLNAPAGVPSEEGNTSDSPTAGDSKVPSPLKEVVPPSNAPFAAPKARADAPATPAPIMGSKKIGGSIPEGGASPVNKSTDSSIPSVSGQSSSTSQQVASSVPATGTGQLREPATFGAQQQSATAKADTTAVTPVSPTTDVPRGSLAAPAASPVTPTSPSVSGSTSRVTPPASPTESSADINKMKVGSGTLADSNNLVSLDSRYIASIIDNRVIIKDKSGKVLFTSARVRTDSDKVILVEWTSDSKLTYQVINLAGTRTYVINAINWTEANK